MCKVDRFCVISDRTPHSQHFTLQELADQNARDIHEPGCALMKPHPGRDCHWPGKTYPERDLDEPLMHSGFESKSNEELFNQLRFLWSGKIDDKRLMDEVRKRLCVKPVDGPEPQRTSPTLEGLETRISNMERMIWPRGR